MKFKLYLLPKEFSSNLVSATTDSGKTIEVKDFAIGVESSDIARFGDIETFQTAWLGSWHAFFDQHQDTAFSQKEIFEYCDRLTKLFGINT